MRGDHLFPCTVSREGPFLQRNIWFGWVPYFLATADMLIPCCSASSTNTFLSCADHRRQSCTDVMTSTVSIALFFLELVLTLILLLQLIPRWKSVWSKQGLRHGSCERRLKSLHFFPPVMIGNGFFNIHQFANYGRNNPDIFLLRRLHSFYDRFIPGVKGQDKCCPMDR